MCGIFVSAILSNESENDPNFHEVCLQLRKANALRGNIKFDNICSAMHDSFC